MTPDPLYYFALVPALALAAAWAIGRIRVDVPDDGGVDPLPLFDRDGHLCELLTTTPDLGDRHAHRN